MNHMSKLTVYLNTEIENRGWSMRELARRACMSSTQVMNVLNGEANLGFKFCISIAHALDILPENLLRIAGLLPTLPPAVEEEKEAVALFRQLSTEARAVVVTTMRSLLNLSITSAVESSKVGETSGGKEKQNNPPLGDAILGMDNPIRICYEVLVDMMTSQQMSEFVTRLIEKVAEIDATNRTNHDVQGLALDRGDGNNVCAVPERARMSKRPPN